MSGSAAIAGARRRRASNEPISTIRDNKQDETAKTNPQESKTYSVVQVIQIHENRLKRLEEKILGMDDNVKDTTIKQDNKILERIVKLESAINDISKDNKDNKDNKDITNIEKFITNSIVELDNKLKAENIDNHNNFDKMHNKISSIEENLEKINSTISIEKILTELNELKTIVIKSQLLSLETANKLTALETLSDKQNVDNENMTSSDNLLFLETLLKNEYNVDLNNLTEPINTTDENVDLDLENIIDISSIVSIDNSTQFTLEEINNNHNDQDDRDDQDERDDQDNKDNKDKIDEDK